MAQPRSLPKPSGRLRLLLSPWARWTCAIVNVLPVPGVGAVIAGWRNPHTTLLRNGLLQFALVLFGAWPLVIPGVVGVAWAAFDAVRIARAEPVAAPASP